MEVEYERRFQFGENECGCTADRNFQIIKSEITKNVSGKIPVFRILFNIPSIFFDVLRGIVGVCVLLAPRNDIIGSSDVIFSTDTLVQVIQRKPELISVQAVSTVEFRNIALAQTGGDYDFSILFCFFIVFEIVILMFKKCLERLDVSTDLAQITWTNEFADFNSFPMQKHLGKISAYLNKMSGVTMKLGLDENGELKVMPDFHSVFDAARFALSQYVFYPTDYPIAYADRVGVATCECCGRLFIKNGNRQKYCDNPECKKERNRRKSRTAYRRKIQEENDTRWA